MLSEVRRVKFETLAAQYGQSETFGQFAAVIARTQTLRSELLAKAKTLVEAGELTEKGLTKALDKDRTATLASLQGLRAANAKRAESLASGVQPKIPERPADAARLVEHFNRMTIDRRVHALARCTAGQDDELTAALLHDIRFVNITSTMEGLLRKRFTEVNPETEGLLSAAHIADQEIEAAIEELENVEVSG